jgi:hypothetical protein
MSGQKCNGYSFQIAYDNGIARLAERRFNMYLFRIGEAVHFIETASGYHPNFRFSH